MTTVVMVNPADVNLADAKALAAQHEATIVGSPYVPRGQMFLTDSEVADLETPNRPANPSRD